ncbi:MAG: hypothetical protein U0441_04050 [Polyangiaceae bacterium]
MTTTPRPPQSSAPPPPDDWTSRPPFKFLGYFDQTESETFHGRKRECAELASLIASERTVVLYGRSGVGKTSLLLAGVFPELTRRGFFPLTARLLKEPVRDLCEAIARAAEVSAEGSLREVLDRAAAAKGPLVVVLDQLEELFVRFPRSEDRAPVLMEISKAVATPEVRARFVFSLRQDYVAELEDLEGPLSDLLDRRYRLRGLTSASAREAISQPLYRAEIEFSQKLLNRLVDMLKADAFDPPVLQIVCTELWRKAAQNHPDRAELDEKDLDDAGDRDTIFQRYLRRAIESAKETDHFKLRGILSGLVTSQGTKKATTKEHLAERERFRASREEVDRLITHLVRENVVREEMRGEELWYELIHERLVDVIEPWLASDSRFFAFRFASDLIEKLAENPVWRDDSSALIAGAQIDSLITPIQEQLRLMTDEERELLLRSAIYARSVDLLSWAKEYSIEGVGDLLLTLLGDADVEVRRTAILAATKLRAVKPPKGVVGAGAEGTDALPAPEPELVEACLQLALSDPEKAVQTAAAGAFAAFGVEEATAPLREALEWEITAKVNGEDEITDEEREAREAARGAALSVLIAWIRAGRPTAGTFRPEDVEEAVRIYERDVLEQGTKVIDAQVVAALKSCILALLTWLPGVGLLVFCVGAVTIAPWHYKDTALLLAAATGSFLTFSVFLALPFAARRVMRGILVEKPVSWWRLFRHPWFLFGAGIPLFLSQATMWTGAAEGWGDDSRKAQGLLGAGLFTVVGLLLSLLVAHLADRGRRGGATRWFATLVVPLAAVGLAEIVTILGWPLANWLERPLAAHAGGWVLATSLGAFAVTTLRALSLHTPAPNEKTSSYRALTTILALFALVSLIAYVSFTGTPLLARKLDIGIPGAEPLHISTRNPLVPVRWRRLVNSTDKMLFLGGDLGIGGIRGDRFIWPHGGTMSILVPPGESPVAFLSTDPEPSSIAIKPMLQENGQMELPTCFGGPESRCVLRETRLQRFSFQDGQTWTAKIEIQEEPEALRSTRALSVQAVLFHTPRGYFVPYITTGPTEQAGAETVVSLRVHLTDEQATPFLPDEHWRVAYSRPDSTRPWTVLFDVRSLYDDFPADFFGEETSVSVVTIAVVEERKTPFPPP